MIRIGEILDVVVLVSGDGDFVELADYLKHHGRQVEPSLSAKPPPPSCARSWTISSTCPRTRTNI